MRETATPVRRKKEEKVSTIRAESRAVFGDAGPEGEWLMADEGMTNEE